MCNIAISNRFKVPFERPVVTVFSSNLTFFYFCQEIFLCGIIVALEGEMFGLHTKHSLSDLVCCFLRGSYRLFVSFQRGQSLLVELSDCFNSSLVGCLR